MLRWAPGFSFFNAYHIRQSPHALLHTCTPFGSINRTSSTLLRLTPLPAYFGGRFTSIKTVRAPDAVTQSFTIPKTEVWVTAQFDNAFVRWATGWFELNAQTFLPHACRLKYLLECHIYCIMLTPMNSEKGLLGHIDYINGDVGLESPTIGHTKSL